METSSLAVAPGKVLPFLLALQDIAGPEDA